MTLMLMKDWFLKKNHMVQKNSFEYFIGYNNNDVVRPLCIKLPQIIRYVRSFESSTTMSFKINDKQLLKKYNQIWKKVKNLLKIKFDSEPVYGDNGKYIKTKIKIYDGNVNINFQDKGMPKEKASCKRLSIIMLDSVVKVKKKYYLETLLEECRFEIKKTKMENFIDDDLEKSLSLIMSLMMILMMKRILAMRKIMMNPMNNLLKAKKVF